MKRHATRGIIIMLAMMIAVLACAPFTVHAKGSPVTGTSWNQNDYVTWQAPVDPDPVDGYYVRLIKDGSTIDSEVVTTTSFYPYVIMNQFGHGFYICTIQAMYDDGGGEATLSDPVESPGYYYEHPMDHHPTKAATCTEDGVNGYYYCPVCDLYFWNAEGTEIIYNPTDTKVPATGHNWGEWQVTKKPTADSEGEEKRVCKNDSSHVETRSIPKLNAPTTVPVTTVPSTTSATEPSTVEGTTSATAPSGWNIATNPSSGNEGGFGGFIHDNPWVLFVGIGLILLILIAVPIVVVIIIVSKKKKARNNPPTPPRNDPPQGGRPNNPYPPQNPNQQNNYQNQNNTPQQGYYQNQNNNPQQGYYQDQNNNPQQGYYQNQNNNPQQGYYQNPNNDPQQNYYQNQNGNAPQSPYPSQNGGAPQNPPLNNNDYNDFFE